MNEINIGDRVFIYDYASDLFIHDGEVIDREEGQALVLVSMREYGIAIADWFDVEKLYVYKKSKATA